MSAKSLFFDHALLPSGWARDVRIDVESGNIVAVTPDAVRDNAQHLPGIALPGLPNLHSHAFQRGMAGLSERRSAAHDSFWTWRETMYRFLARLSPDDVEAIAAYAYMEMLEAGFTAVGEFHYLHHDIDGRPYADLAEMAARIAAASAQTGIGITLLPSVYMHGGFGGAAPAEGQRRFLNSPDQFLKLLERTRAVAAPVTDSRVGIAPHSLRAVTPEALRLVCDAVRQGPIHIHAAEQVREVEESLQHLGCRPVQWLLDFGIDARWCVIHATHMTEEETRGLAGCGAVAGLCPLTEASLGDGIFDAPNYLGAGGRFGVGTDSNIQIDAAAELRQLEYAQRLARRERNVIATEGQSTGRRLFESALAGGVQALGRRIGAIAPGCRADIVVLDGEHTDLASRNGDNWLDGWIFVAGRPAVNTVRVGGEVLVEQGRHRLRDRVEARYRAVLTNLLRG